MESDTIHEALRMVSRRNDSSQEPLRFCLTVRIARMAANIFDERLIDRADVLEESAQILTFDAELESVVIEEEDLARVRATGRHEIELPVAGISPMTM